MYQRTVMHARGWRQVPNYFVWAGMLAFVWVRISPILNLFPFLSSSSPSPSFSPPSPHTRYSLPLKWPHAARA